MMIVLLACVTRITASWWWNRKMKKLLLTCVTGSTAEVMWCSDHLTTIAMMSQSSVDNVGHGNWELAGCRAEKVSTDQDRCLGVTLSVRDVMRMRMIMMMKNMMIMIMMMMMMTSLFLLQRAGWAAPQAWCLVILWILSRWYNWSIRGLHSSKFKPIRDLNSSQSDTSILTIDKSKGILVTIYQLHAVL